MEIKLEDVPSILPRTRRLGIFRKKKKKSLRKRQAKYLRSPDKRDIRPQIESLVSPFNQIGKSLDKPT